MQQDQYDSWDSGTYRTGSTTPPKGYSRLVAILLVIVVLLAGLVSILSVLNIRLFTEFRSNQHAEKSSLSLEIGKDSDPDLLLGDPNTATVSGNRSIGIAGDIISPAYQEHFHLPQGLLITYVEEGSFAENQGIREGDVLLSIENIPITDTYSLKTLIKSMEEDQEYNARIHRRDVDEPLKVILKIEPTKP